MEKRKYIETKKEEYRNNKGCELEENGIKIDVWGIDVLAFMIIFVSLHHHWNEFE
mgnify:FL=1